MKFLLDQTVGSVGNIVLFIVLINLLKGVGVGGVWGLVVEVSFSFIYFSISFYSILLCFSLFRFVCDMGANSMCRTSNPS